MVAADCATLVVTIDALPKAGYRVYRMTEEMHERQELVREIAKAPTGIKGLDEITLGGLPKGRPTLVCGSAGSGKTLLGMEFLIHGAQLGEPGVCITFEERVDDLITNVASLGFDHAHSGNDSARANLILPSGGLHPCHFLRGERVEIR